MAYTTFGFFLYPGDSVNVPKDRIRWIARPLGILCQLRKFGTNQLLHGDDCMWMYTYFARRHLKFKSGISFCRSNISVAKK